MVSVYVSYAWKEEAQKPLVARLAEACAARGIELRYDRKEMRYGDSISQFMKRIGAAEHIVLVLSAAYFKSDYCMDELCQICARGHFRKRVSPIVLAGTSFHKPKDGIGYLQHWEQQIAELRNGLGALDSHEHTPRSQTALDHYREFRGMMEELQGILADMNTLSEDEHLESGFAAVLDRILAGSTASKPDPFRQQLVAEIQKTLAAPSSAELVKALQNKIADARVAPGDDLAKCLCDGDPERAIEDLLFPATRNALLPLDAKQAEFANTWNAAKSVLAWLSLLAVDGEWLDQASRKALSDGQLNFEIVVETALGVELVSSRVRQIAPRLRAQPGTSEVVGDELISEPQYDSGWNDDAALERLLREVWMRVFPEESRQRLSAKDLKTLNNELLFRHRHKTFHHYIPVARGQESRLCQPEFYRRLLAKLPDISVIYFQPYGGTPALLVSDEDYFRTVMRNFLTIPEQLARKP